MNFTLKIHWFSLLLDCTLFDICSVNLLINLLLDEFSKSVFLNWSCLKVLCHVSELSENPTYLSPWRGHKQQGHKRPGENQHGCSRSVITREEEDEDEEAEDILPCMQNINRTCQTEAYWVLTWKPEDRSVQVLPSESFYTVQVLRTMIYQNVQTQHTFIAVNGNLWVCEGLHLLYVCASLSLSVCMQAQYEGP